MVGSQYRFALWLDFQPSYILPNNSQTDQNFRRWGPQLQRQWPHLETQWSFVMTPPEARRLMVSWGMSGACVFNGSPYVALLAKSMLPK